MERVTSKVTLRRILLSLFVCCSLPLTGYALEPAEVAVICNSFIEESSELAEYYMQARSIPERSLIKIRLSETMSISRQEYDENVAAPVRKALQTRFAPGEIKALVVMYGMPLKVGAPQTVRQRREDLEKRIGALKGLLKTGTEPERKDELEKRLKGFQKEAENYRDAAYRASLDSELALILAGDYPLAAWVPNPFFLGNKGKSADLPVQKPSVLMVGRLDGPGPAVVKRIIDDSLEAEKEGLSGTAYFDARYPRPAKTDVKGTAYYDLSIHLAAERVRKSGRLAVVVDDQSGLFQPGDAPDAALYCGWYSLARYVDAFTWKKGAIGYHIASQECQTLRAGSSQVWCKRMLEEGAAAVIGPVGEPYAQAFPVPEAFFGLLVDGYYTLAESYFLSLPWLSWKMVLVGDPLYRPFGAGR